MPTAHSDAADQRLWFTVPAHRVRRRADPGYAAAAIAVDRRYADSAYPLVRIGDLATSIDYGSSTRSSTGGEGLPMVRMGNVRDGYLDLRSLKHVALSPEEATRFALAPGDLLFNRTNSKELVGKTAVFAEDGSFVYASYLLRVRFDAERVLPEYASAFLNSRSGRLQIDRDSRQIIGMANVNAAELREFLLPLPPLAEQRRLVEPILAARAATRDAERDAERVDADVDALLMTELDLTVEDPENLLTFAVPTRALRRHRLDALAHLPALHATSRSSGRLVALEDVARVNPRREPPPAHDERVPYVGLPECDRTTVREVVLRPREEVAGWAIAQPGDILFARIEPSVFNRKYVFVSDLHDYERVYTSAEFYVVEADSEQIDRHFLHELLLSSIVAPQVRGKTTGSSGRRRIDPGLFASLQLPLPPLATQHRLAERIASRREVVRSALENGATRVQRELDAFEAALFGTP